MSFGYFIDELFTTVLHLLRDTLRNYSIYSSGAAQHNISERFRSPSETTCANELERSGAARRAQCSTSRQTTARAVFIWRPEGRSNDRHHRRWGPQRRAR